MFDNLRQDIARLKEVKRRPTVGCVVEALLLDSGFQAVVLYRLAHWFRARRIPFLGHFFSRLSQFLNGVDISPAARIGPGLFISHGSGTVVGGAVQAGARLFLLHQVTIGASTLTRLDDMPVLGDDVFLGAGACLIGPVHVGDRAFIGAKALVTRDVPAGGKVFAPSSLELWRSPRVGRDNGVPEPQAPETGEAGGP